MDKQARIWTSSIVSGNIFRTRKFSPTSRVFLKKMSKIIRATTRVLQFTNSEPVRRETRRGNRVCGILWRKCTIEFGTAFGILIGGFFYERQRKKCFLPCVFMKTNPRKSSFLPLMALFFFSLWLRSTIQVTHDYAFLFMGFYWALLWLCFY